MFRCFLLLPLLLSWWPAQAQREYFNWYFGDRAGLTFTTTPPQALTDGQRSFPYGAACISDSVGQFLLASDGYTVWDRRWQPLPSTVCGYPVVDIGRRQALLVRQPGPGRRYYVVRSSLRFPPGQTSAPSTVPSLPYAVIDANARGGYGAIVARDSIVLPAGGTITLPYYQLNANWIPVHHANGRDIWLVGQTIDGFYVSCLLTAAGLSAPLVSRPQPLRYLALSLGVLKASPDGRLLASEAGYQRPVGPTNALIQIELAAFDPATGRVSSSYYLPREFPGVGGGPGSNGFSLLPLWGLAFSADGSKLYASQHQDSEVLQYDLLAGSPAAIVASEAKVPALNPLTTGIDDRSLDLQLGPDGNIYVMRLLADGVGRIEQANAPAPFCRLVGSSVRLPPGTNPRYYNFPITLNDLNLPPVQIVSGGTIAGSGPGQGGSGGASGALAAGGQCAGSPVPFASSLSPFVTASAFAWDFGDPASGAANQAGGQAPVHRYAQGGTYSVTLRITTPDGRQFTTSQAIRVYDCEFVPNIITPNGDQTNEAFVLGDPQPEAYTLVVYNRWGREVYRQTGYDNSWAAAGQPAGIYYYLLTNHLTGARRKGWVEVAK